jgi:microcystin-dependent protein
MAKTKVSEWDVVADNNQDISGITLGTGMPPSYVNDSIREVMAQIKDWQSGSSGDDYTITGNLGVNGTLTINGSSGTSGQVLVSQGDGAVPKWGDAFITGMIMLWSGATDAVPAGWSLCDGTGNTPDLRDRFVVGAGNSYDVNATGGSANAIAISHSHTATTSVSTKSLGGTIKTRNGGGGRYADSVPVTTTGVFTWKNLTGGVGNGWQGEGGGNSATITMNANHNHSASTSVKSAGSSGTNANLPPYYALAYIMKV